jgi:general secretion pathway protein D
MEESQGAPKEGIQLAFTDTDINQVISSVLGEGLGLSYSIDPSVKGTISLRSSRPLTPAELLPALEAALRLQDLAIVESKGNYAVVPFKDASRRVGAFNASGRHQPGFSIQVVPLQFIGAPDMEKILAPLAPPGAVVRVDESRNLLLLAGTSDEQANMSEVIKTFDVDWLAGMSYAMFRLNYVDAKTAVSELSEIFADPKSPLTGVVRLVPLARLNSILAITPLQKYLPSVEEWIKRLDVGGTTPGRRIYVYDVQNGKAEDLAESLNHILSINSYSDAPRSPSSGSSAGSTASGNFSFGSTSGGVAASGSGGPFSASTNSTRTSNENGTNALDTGNLRIVPNDESNSLLILATPTEFGTIEAALLRLDSPNRQVLIEASLAEVALTDELRYGVQWSYSTHDGPIVLSRASTGQVSTTFPGFSYLFTGSTDIRAALNALESITKVRVLSSPKLVTLNNHEAQLQVGD